jgi:putative isomerase
MLFYLLLLLTTTSAPATSVHQGVNFYSFSNLAFSGSLAAPSTVSNIGVVPSNAKQDDAAATAAVAFRWTGTLALTKGLYVFSLRSSRKLLGGYARLWIDDHLLLDGVLGSSLTARYPLPIPFFSPTSSRVTLEYVPEICSNDFRFRHVLSSSTPLQLIGVYANNSEITSQSLSTDWPKAESTYSNERVQQERGWNTWLDTDLLTHALLPHGLALSLSFRSTASGAKSSQLGTPSCNRTLFPAKHGVHDVRGEYTELSEYDFDNSRFRIESATDPVDESTNLILITRLKQVNDSATTISLNASVPSLWAPRSCNITTTNTNTTNTTTSPLILSACPGLSPVVVQAVVLGYYDYTTAAAATITTTATGFDVLFPSTCEMVAFAASSSSSSSSLPNYTLKHVQAIIAQRRSALQKRFQTMAASTASTTTSNETAAGLATSIGWNVIYTAQEGIIAPVFRGSVWGLDQGSGYVLFEWDTFLAGWIALYIDPWLAKSNLIRMAKSMVVDSVHGGGFVAGFWNGHCGEYDKSKPPVGSLLLEQILNANMSTNNNNNDNDNDNDNNTWVGEIVLDQLAAWSKWWVDTRFVQEVNGTSNSSLYAPGSTRELMHSPLMCVYQKPVDASKCETGLDNSPLYDTATFVTSTDTLDQTDVGMSSLILADALALARVAKKLGAMDVAHELELRGAIIQQTLRSLSWDARSGLYRNRNWEKRNFVEPRMAAPTSFYPMISRTPTDDQVQTMLSRWLRNSSEFCVDKICPFGISSIARSSPAALDNDYWRGRAWGPMNFLVYLGLLQYTHLPEVVESLKILAKQSEATFLVEWEANHRVMENYNSFTGVGCDVGNANSFYHWGALNALLPFIKYDEGNF